MSVNTAHRRPEGKHPGENQRLEAVRRFVAR